MARVKKSRKVGRIGVPKESWAPRKPKDPTNSKPKKHKGNPSGSRHNSVQQTDQQHSQSKQTDPRIGSKKPIQLVVEPKELKAKAKPIKPKYFSPAQELTALENNERLNDLLDLMDKGIGLNSDDQRYVDLKLARHKELCDLMGINEASESDNSKVKTDEDDPFARFESINIDKFK